jgi:hypothetical protein
MDCAVLDAALEDEKTYVRDEVNAEDDVEPPPVEPTLRSLEQWSSRVTAMARWSATSLDPQWEHQIL